MRSLLFLVMFFIIFLLVSCSENSTNPSETNTIQQSPLSMPDNQHSNNEDSNIKEQGEEQNVAVIVETEEETGAKVIEDVEFSLQLKEDERLEIYTRENTIDLDALFGKRLSEQKEEIIIGDVHDVSFIKTIEYEGISIELFAPAQDPENFWIMAIKVTSPNYRSYRGIHVGQTVDDIKHAYPEDINWYRRDQLYPEIDWSNNEQGSELISASLSIEFLTVHFRLEDDVITEMNIGTYLP